MAGPKALYFTDDPKACELLAQDPFALLIGFAIDQQVPVPTAFMGPLRLKQRVGTLDPKKLAKLDLQPAFRETSTAARRRASGRTRRTATISSGASRRCPGTAR